MTIIVPIGQTKATGQVNAGTATGRVTLSGAVSGVNQAPARETFVVLNPGFVAVVGDSLDADRQKKLIDDFIATGVAPTASPQTSGKTAEA